MNKIRSFTTALIAAGACTASGCAGIVDFSTGSAPQRSVVVRSDTVAGLAAAAQAASIRAAAYQHSLWQCRFEQPGRPDRMLNRPVTDPAIAACLARNARSG